MLSHRKLNLSGGSIKHACMLATAMIAEDEKLLRGSLRCVSINWILHNQ